MPPVPLFRTACRLLACWLAAGTLALAGGTARADAPTPIVPTHLAIPSIGVDAPLDQVGLTPDKAVESPQQWFVPAWYKLGYKPGDFGNAAIIGHLDSTTGPAVFWNVRYLRAGATVLVDDGTTTLTFLVQSVETCPSDQCDMQRVYGPSDAPRLNLITCAGDWNPDTHRYSDRLVVYTVLQGFQGAAANSRYFGQTGGYVVANDTQARFLSEFYRLGGVDALGYPVSRRFMLDGFVVQAFQKAILQWHPDTGQATFVNVLDRLHDAGQDGWLQSRRMTPPPADTSADSGLAWSDVVARHEAYLSANATLQAAYFNVDDPVARYGLPVSPVTDEGAALVVRCQRAVLQLWKQDEPWAAAGQVTVANGGDLAKEAGLIPASAAAPQPQ